MLEKINVPTAPAKTATSFLKGKESDLFIHSRNNIYVMIYADDMLGCFKKDAHRSTLCHLTILLLHAKLYFINSCK